MNRKTPEIRIGLVGTGFIAKGLALQLKDNPHLSISKVLTRRLPESVTDLPINSDQITNDPYTLIKNSDLCFISTGDPIYGTEIAIHALEEHLPVVTMDAELQVTTGSFLARQGLFTEAQGDQPGSTAVLREEVLAMGFEPVVYGNIKGFLNHNPTRKDMEYWAKKQGISLTQVTSFTDGTKVQIEQTLTANAFGATITRTGLDGLKCKDIKSGGLELALKARKIGQAISDYLLPENRYPGVFVVTETTEQQLPYVQYYKVRINDTPFVLLERPYHLCHFEAIQTLNKILYTGKILLNNSVAPTVSVAAIAKKELLPGNKIDRAIGSFYTRGEAIRITDYPNHIPIGLLQDAVIERKIEPGQILTFDDVFIPDSLATFAWRTINQKTKEELIPVSV